MTQVYRVSVDSLGDTAALLAPSRGDGDGDGGIGRGHCGNVHGVACQLNPETQAHNLVLTAAYANCVGMVELTSPAITRMLTGA